MARNQARFDGYMAVDWSSSASRCQGANSVWIAFLGPTGQMQIHNPGTRREAIELIGEILTEANGRGHRLLCGCSTSHSGSLRAPPRC